MLIRVAFLVYMFSWGGFSRDLGIRHLAISAVKGIGRETDFARMKNLKRSRHCDWILGAMEEPEASVHASLSELKMPGGVLLYAEVGSDVSSILPS